MYYQLIPDYIAKPWAGSHLKNLEGVGEIILASDLSDFNVQVQTEKGTIPFSKFWTSRFDTPFPLLLKVLSIQDPLSIQVHPSDDDVRKLNLTGNGKTEAWLILDSTPDTVAYFGVKDFDGFSEKLDRGNVQLEDFNVVNPQEGEIFLLRPGLVHGTSGSLLIFEVQQPSTHTFRIYDYERGRKLHLTEAKHVVKDIEIQSARKSLRNEYFNMDVHVLGEQPITTSPHSVDIFTYIGPDTGLTINERYEFSAQFGTTFISLNPSSTKITFSPDVRHHLPEGALCVHVFQ